MAVAVDLDNRRLAEGLARALALGGQTPSLTAAAGRSSSTLRVETLSSSTPEHALGLALAWLLVNKPPAAHCTLRLCGEADAGAQPIVLHASPVAAAAKAAATAGVDASLARDRDCGDVAAGAAGARPSECVEVYHLHAHFETTRGDRRQRRSRCSVRHVRRFAARARCRCTSTCGTVKMGRTTHGAGSFGSRASARWASPPQRWRAGAAPRPPTRRRWAYMCACTPTQTRSGQLGCIDVCLQKYVLRTESSAFDLKHEMNQRYNYYYYYYYISLF